MGHIGQKLRFVFVGFFRIQDRLPQQPLVFFPLALAANSSK